MEDYSSLIDEYNLSFMTQDHLLSAVLEGGDSSYNNNHPLINCTESNYHDHILRFDNHQRLDYELGAKEERGWSSKLGRSPTQAQEHVMAERKRREKLSEHFIALSALLPNLKKMDKASILGDAAKYMKQLQERVQVLEEQAKKTTVESVVSRISDEAILPEMEARVSEKDVLIRIHCKNEQKVIVAKMISQMESFNLSVENTIVLPFGTFNLDVTIVAQMDDEFKMTLKELVRKLRLALLKLL